MTNFSFDYLQSSRKRMMEQAELIEEYSRSWKAEAKSLFSRQSELLRIQKWSTAVEII